MAEHQDTSALVFARVREAGDLARMLARAGDQEVTTPELTTSKVSVHYLQTIILRLLVNADDELSPQDAVRLAGALKQLQRVIADTVKLEEQLAQRTTEKTAHGAAKREAAAEAMRLLGIGDA